MTNLKVGQKIYYTGDMANTSDFGEIVNIINDKWGLRYDVKLNDGRLFRAVMHLGFDKGPGQRFKTIEQWQEERQESLKRLKAFVNR